MESPLGPTPIVEVGVMVLLEAFTLRKIITFVHPIKVSVKFLFFVFLKY